MKTEVCLDPFLFEHGIILEWCPEPVSTKTSAVLHETFVDNGIEEFGVKFEELVISYKELVRSEPAQTRTV
jgi:hypothetical protein